MRLASVYGGGLHVRLARTPERHSLVRTYDMGIIIGPVFHASDVLSAEPIFTFFTRYITGSELLCSSTS